jgi:flagellar biosynthesis protein
MYLVGLLVCLQRWVRKMSNQPAETPLARRSAVALEYDPERDSAPRLTAKGRGAVAYRILEIAQASGIPIVQDPDLVEVLAAVELEREIPSRLYEAVAEVLVFVYRVNREAAEGSR